MRGAADRHSASRSMPPSVRRHALKEERGEYARQQAEEIIWTAHFLRSVVGLIVQRLGLWTNCADPVEDCARRGRGHRDLCVSTWIRFGSTERMGGLLLGSQQPSSTASRWSASATKDLAGRTFDPQSRGAAGQSCVAIGSLLNCIQRVHQINHVARFRP